MIEQNQSKFPQKEIQRKFNNLDIFLSSRHTHQKHFIIILFSYIRSNIDICDTVFVGCPPAQYINAISRPLFLKKMINYMSYLGYAVCLVGWTAFAQNPRKNYMGRFQLCINKGPPGKRTKCWPCVRLYPQTSVQLKKCFGN